MKIEIVSISAVTARLIMDSLGASIDGLELKIHIELGDHGYAEDECENPTVEYLRDLITSRTAEMNALRAGFPADYDWASIEHEFN